MKFCDKQNEVENKDENKVAHHDIQGLMERTDVSTKFFNLEGYMVITSKNESKKSGLIIK